MKNILGIGLLIRDKIFIKIFPQIRIQKRFKKKKKK